MPRINILLPFLMACGDPDLCALPDCEQVQARKSAVLTACGLPAQTANIDCDETNVQRLDCQVSCMESAACVVLDGSDIWHLTSPGSYYDCLDDCPGIASP